MTRPIEEFRPMRIVIRPTDDGKYEGLIENSFDMGWSRERVCIFWSGKAYSILGEHQINGVEWAQQNCNTARGELMFDPEDPACPVDVNLKYWHESWARRGKFDQRNGPFKMRLEEGVLPA